MPAPRCTRRSSPLAPGFVIGATEQEARAKEAEYDRHVSIDGYLAHSALVDQKTGRVYPPQTPLSQIDTNTRKGFAAAASGHTTGREPLVEDLAWRQARNLRIVGTPEQIADRLQQWQDAGVDGVNVVNWVIPGSFAEFADEVLLVLRERGLAQSDYTEGTLRAKLFGTDRLNDRHPAAAYRGAFARVDPAPAEAAIAAP